MKTRYIVFSVLFFLLSGCTSVNDPSLLPVTPVASATVPLSPTLTLEPITATSTAEPEIIAQPETVTASPTPLEPTQAAPTETPEPTPSPEPVSGPTSTPPAGGIIVDSRSVELFEMIPDEYLEAARNTKMVFVDRSVGFNINQALDCLSANSWAEAPSYCRRDYFDDQWNWKTFARDDYLNNRVPSTILFEPDPVKYDRSNWVFQVQRGNWEEVVQDFIEVQVPFYVDEYQVLSYQFNYFHISEGSTIDGEVRADGKVLPGFFDVILDDPDHWDISKLEALEAKYPDRTFFLWTTSLARSVGSVDGENFNDQMREYAIANGKILFDVADIESHDPAGNACYDSRDGICYCNSNQCEDYSRYGQSCDWNDGVDLLAICQDYTTETLGGHLGSVSAGKLRIAKAFWVLMARIAGWDGQPQ